MPGQLCTGFDLKSADVMLSKAYCEGRKALYGSWPGAFQNPHAEGSDANVAWKAGFDSVSAPTDPIGPVDCCALPARSL